MTSFSYLEKLVLNLFFFYYFLLTLYQTFSDVTVVTVIRLVRSIDLCLYFQPEMSHSHTNVPFVCHNPCLVDIQGSMVVFV